MAAPHRSPGAPGSSLHFCDGTTPLNTGLPFLQRKPRAPTLVPVPDARVGPVVFAPLWTCAPLGGTGRRSLCRRGGRRSAA